MRQLEGRIYAHEPEYQFNTQRVDPVLSSPTWTETLHAQIGYNYQSFLNAAYIESRYGDVAYDDSLNVMEEIKGSQYEQYYNSFKDAKNINHLNDLKSQVDAMKRRRQILANSSLFAQFTTGIFDPLNLIALPFGGPAFGVAKSALRVGLGVTALQAPLEVGRQLFDPTATYGESALNLGAGFFVGGTLGGLTAVAGNVRVNAMFKTQQEISEMARVTNSVDAEQMALVGQRKQRQTTPEFFNLRMDELSDADVDKLTNPNGAVDFLQNRVNSEGKKMYSDSQLRGNLTQDNIKAMNKYFEGEKQLRTLENKNGDMKDNFNLMENLFTKSWLYKGVTNPYKRVLQSKEYSQDAKLAMIRLIGDHGTALQAQQNGAKAPDSVYINASAYEGEWVRRYDELLDIYGQITGKGKPVEAKFDYLFRRKGFETWLEETWKKSLKDPKGLAMTELEQKAVRSWNEFFQTWEDRLKKTGHLATKENLIARNQTAADRIFKINQRLEKAGSNKDLIEELNFQKDKLSKEIQKNESALEVTPSEATYKSQAGEDSFFPRFWNKNRIKEQRQSFKQILMNEFRKNPEQISYVKRYAKDGKKVSREELTGTEAKTFMNKEYVKLAVNESDIEKRADEAIEAILGEGDPFQTMSYGFGKSKHFKHRNIDVPNEIVQDFIITNPVQVMMAYTNRTASQYEFYKAFDFEDPEIAISDIISKELARGVSKKSANKLRRDFLHSYDRVAGVVLQNPEALNLRIATVMKDLATLNYLGSAGFSTLPDAAVVMMTNDLKPLFSQVIRVLDNEKVRMNAMEARLAGEMLEILKGDVHLRLMEDMLNNPFQSTWTSKAKNTFFQLNLLGPMTRTFKMFSSMANSHTIIDYSIKMANGTAGDKEIKWLLKNGINKKDATKINNMRKKEFIEDSDGFYLANSEAWDDPEATQIFRRTLNATVKNTVLMGSPADKPIAVDGVFYVPMAIGRLMRLTEDKRIRGYARVENAMLGLPFQFYSYSFAALNKITTLYAQDQVTNRLTGIVAAMGLAYMGMQLKYRSNPFVLEQMTLEDKMARAFDMSGLAALYSDTFYTAMHTSMALGGPDIGMGMISPKFPQKESTLDAVAGLGGSGVSITSDLVTSMGTFLSGNYGEGAKEFISNLPGARLWFLRDFVNDMSRGIAGRLG